MEPRRDDGDDDALKVAAGVDDKPQWSPVVTTGTTTANQNSESVAARPQWSPVVTTGTTGDHPTSGRHVAHAAMEPRRDDGDDRNPHRVRTDARAAAMEPRRDDGDDSMTGASQAGISLSPQWSPVVTTGTTRLPPTTPPVPTSRRNGAPS